MNELEQLKSENEAMRKFLQSIIDSCVHPDIAVRALFVPVEPIRQLLKIKTNSK